MAKDNKDIEGEEEGGGGKLKLIIIIAAAVLLIGGGAVAFFLLGGDEGATEGEPTEEVAETEEPAIEEGDPLYVDMKPQFVVNLPPGGPAKMLQVAITIYTRQAEVGDWITKNDPMIRHHMIELLEEQDGAALLTVEGKQALQTSIQDFLSKKLEEMSQPGEIKGVFFTEFVLQ
jgi:flagellar FliL protein